MGRRSNRAGQRHRRRRRRCPQQEECEACTLDLDSRDGRSHERRIRCSQRSEGRRSPPLVPRWISGRQVLTDALAAVDAVRLDDFARVGRDHPQGSFRDTGPIQVPCPRPSIRRQGTAQGHSLLVGIACGHGPLTHAATPQPCGPEVRLSPRVRLPTKRNRPPSAVVYPRQVPYVARRRRETQARRSRRQILPLGKRRRRS